MRNNILTLFVICPSTLLLSLSLPTYADPISERNQHAAVFLISSNVGSGSGFACIYRDKEYVATNLHVIDGADSFSVKSQNGSIITLSGKIIAAGDADICLLGINGKFEESNIIPFKFSTNVFEGSSAGDDVICLGNSLGNGVITSTKGRIKAYGQPRLEIDSPVVKGNSGGPVIHTKTGSVIGLVTEAIVNKSNFDALGKAAKSSKKSQVSDVSYFAHRIDTVVDWTGTTIKQYYKTGKSLENADSGINKTLLFLASKDGTPNGWETDPRLTQNWKEYQSFIDSSAAKTKKSVKVTEHVNEYGFVVRRDVRVRSQSVSEADYTKAKERFLRGVEWKILSDQETLKKTIPIGYRQTEQRRSSLGGV